MNARPQLARLVLVVVTISILIVPSARSDNSNLVANPSFETYPTTPGDPPNWTTSTSSTGVTCSPSRSTDVHDGSFSLSLLANVSNSASNDKCYVSSDHFGVTVGLTYALTGWKEEDDQANEFAHIYAVYFDSSGHELSNTDTCDWGNPSTSWVEAVCTATPPLGTASAAVRLEGDFLDRAGFGGGTGTIEFDGIHFTAVYPLTPSSSSCRP